MERLDTNGYYALGLPLYAAIVAAELLIAHRHGRRIYRLADTIGNLAAGVGEVVLGLFLGPILLWLYDFGFEHLALIHWGTDTRGTVITWTLAFILGDLCYYWYHRAGHALAVLWAIHGVHHQAREMNVSVALRHPWFSDVYSAPFYILLPIAGVPPTKFFVAISVISFYALTVHSHFFNRPGFFIFVTPATHIVHHARNPRYLGKNLGAMFTIWDRMFGTHVELDASDPAVLGTTDGYRTHDGALAQWLGFHDLVNLVRETPRFGDKLRVLLKHPGWRPAGVQRREHPPAREDSTIPSRTKLYVVIQMAITIAGAAWVLWFRERHSPLFLVIGAALVLFSLASLGALLDGRIHARRLETARLVVVALALAAFGAWA
jgi:sterol desaturase/sphingolipid hydroxylase (fatty acid hydroxylase superfamily)